MPTESDAQGFVPGGMSIIERLENRAEACRLTGNHVMAEEFQGYADALKALQAEMREHFEQRCKLYEGLTQALQMPWYRVDIPADMKGAEMCPEDEKIIAAVKALQAENEKLEAERRYATHALAVRDETVTALAGTVTDQQFKIAALQAERDVLREALEAVDAELDRQVYGLSRRDTTPYAMRDAGQDLPPEYEHDVLVTEAVWDKIRQAISASPTPEAKQSAESAQCSALRDSEDEDYACALRCAVSTVERYARQGKLQSEEQRAVAVGDALQHGIGIYMLRRSRSTASPTPVKVEAQTVPEGWKLEAVLVEPLDGKSFSRRRVTDIQKHDPRRDDYWFNAEAKAAHKITPLYAAPTPPGDSRTAPPVTDNGVDASSVKTSQAIAQERDEGGSLG